MISWLKNIFSSGSAIKDTLSGVGTLAKDIREVITGDLDPEKKADILLKSKELEYKFQELASNIIIAEANGSWLQRSWRPITMLTFLFIIVSHYYGIIEMEIASEMWLLMQIGIGGYIGGRTIEKVPDKIISAIAKLKK